ncbi:MAG: cellulose synthase/poly-beta-1,6-N-acetylglucosamine synthase-like glycosyltransferase [Limisphaerales bacterium]|jgi:cellulose synthase/poly-beta-1,6-N-acetylglucosamine synthase-like glycosyltransferase
MEELFFIIQILFWLSVGLMAISYMVYPWILALLDNGEKVEKKETKNLPVVTILMAAYNEEAVLEAKIKSVFDTNYPLDKLEFIIGSDGSTDATDSIVRSCAEAGSPVKLIRLEGRNGKSNVLNVIKKEAKGSIWILTDANIIFSNSLITELIAGFSDENVGIIGAIVNNTGSANHGIGVQESGYISRENVIKYREGKLWGTMMGAFGACYAIRSSLFPVIPKNFLMEDFFVSMHVLDSNYKTIMNPDAIVYEDVSTRIKEEFKRKVRISAGNFQNLMAWKHMLWPIGAISTAFFFHKVIRWLGPIFILFCLVSSLVLMSEVAWYKWLVGLQLALLATPLADAVFSKAGLHIRPLRYIAYFYIMNLALFAGLLKYLAGIRTNAWDPTARNQAQQTNNE